MSRTSIYKIIYFVGLIALAAVIPWLAFGYHLSIRGLLLMYVCLLIPGRILGYFWRDLLRGLRLLNEERFAESKMHSELFLVSLGKKPWLKHLIWLGGGAYSRNPKAMALNNLGAAEIGLGDLLSARAHLIAAIEEDQGNPLPAFNMAALTLEEGEPEEAEKWFQKASALGYSGSAIDAIIISSQSRFARRDGRGTS